MTENEQPSKPIIKEVTIMEGGHVKPINNPTAQVRPKPPGGSGGKTEKK